jgi:GTP-binding protein HflX
LTSVQRVNLSKELGIKILDRNEIIIEIFRKNAGSAESKLQVELAKLKYDLPQLVGKGIEMSRTGAGIGTVGPGETQLEYNRREIKEKIHLLKKELKQLEKNRNLMSKRRNKDQTLKISIVGYTSAGKSTLLKNITSEENILISEKLFSTLSPKTRRTKFDTGLELIFSDTVGFIRNIPTQLIEAFKSTLEELNNADFIIKLIDCSDEDFKEKMNVVDKIVNEITEETIPSIVIFNKIDKCPSKLEDLKILFPESLFISAENTKSVKEFLRNMEIYLKRYDILEEKFITVPINEFNYYQKRIGTLGIKKLKTDEKKAEFFLISKKGFY